MSQFKVKSDGIEATVLFIDQCLTITQGDIETRIQYADIIDMDDPSTGETDEQTSDSNLYYIRPSGGFNTLEMKTLQISAGSSDIKQMQSEIKRNLSAVKERPKSVVIFLNPIGGSGNSESIFTKEVEPILKLASIKYELIVSATPDHAKELPASFDFSKYDVLVIMGGDGTLNDLVNGLLLKKQAERNIDVNDHHAALDQLDIPISFIPAGTGNGMANILYGCVDVVTSTLHLVKGGIKDYPVFGNFCENKLVAYSFMMAAYGLFADLIHSVDSQRWLKKLRYLVVPIWFFLFKGLRNFDAELTFEYTQKKKEDKQKSSNPEQALETETEHMTLMNVMALIDKIAFGVDDGLSDDESNKLEFGKEFGLMIYKPAGRFAMIKHFIQLGKAASKEFIDRCDFLSFKVVKALTIRIPKSESDMDLLINLDGQIYKLTKPEIYITLIPNAIKMVSSYSRSTKQTSNITSTDTVL
ncbi:ceramide kinase 1-like isoform X2 [Mytilus galloprovincialis]|uniref:ceramide kinase 1-like isoform X2 n=1 Tax=Mytilus galloprovincialis TaxID=29158 RepID=UPI003F7CBA42